MENELRFDDFIEQEFGSDVKFWKQYAKYLENAYDDEFHDYITKLENAKCELTLYKKAYRSLSQAYCTKGECGFCACYDVCRKMPNFDDCKYRFFNVVEDYFLKEHKGAE